MCPSCDRRSLEGFWVSGLHATAVRPAAARSPHPARAPPRAYVHSLGRRLSICIGKYVTVFQAEIYASYVLMKFRLTLHQRNTLVFALMVKQLWKLYRLLNQRPHWYGRAKGRWMVSPPIICGTLLGPRTFWNTWKWSCRWARKGGFRSPFCWTGAGAGSLKAEYKEENSVLVG